MWEGGSGGGGGVSGEKDMWQGKDVVRVPGEPAVAVPLALLNINIGGGVLLLSSLHAALVYPYTSAARPPGYVNLALRCPP